MKKVIVFACILSLFLLGGKMVASALETAPEEPVGDVTDSIMEEVEYYAKVLMQYVASLGGAITGLLIIFYRIKKTLKDINEGNTSLNQAKEELLKQKDELEIQMQQFIEATTTLKYSIMNQERLEEFGKNVEKLKESIFKIACSDSKLIGSGVAKEIKSILEKEVDADVEQNKVRAV